MASAVRGGIVALCALVPVTAAAQEATVQPSSTVALSGVRAGCFSPQRAFSESAEGKAGIARIEALQREKARLIDEKNKALQTQEATLQQSAGALSEEARIKRTQDLERFRIDTQRFIQDAQAEVTGLQRDVESAFLVKLKPALEQVAKTKGLQLVFNLDADPIAWIDPALDITADVVTQLARATVPAKP